MQRFPQAASGFLYLHKLPGAPEVVAEIRFRVTRDPDPKSFHSGSDLLYHGMPWGLPLLNDKASHYDSLLLHEGFVSQELSKERQRLQMSPKKPFVFAFKQPFLLNSGITQGLYVCYLEDGVPRVERMEWRPSKFRLTKIGKPVFSCMS